MGWQTIAPALIQGGMSAAGNRFSEREARQSWQRTAWWNEYMSSTEIQRRVKDLEAAGINPMLAAMDGAGSPAMAPAQVPDYGRVAESAASAYRFAASEQKIAEATARKLNAEAQLVEAQVPYSAFNARRQSDAISYQADKLAEEIRKIKSDWSKVESEKDLNYFQLEQLMPLAREYQRLKNQAEQLGMSEREADAKMWNALEEAKFLGPIGEIIKILGFVLKSRR